MIKPRPPQQSAREFRRLAKAAVSLGIDFNGAAIGVDHALLRPIGDGLQRLSSALQELSEDLQREAMTPPPAPEPAPKPTPILDFLESREQAEAPPRPAEVVPAPMPERPKVDDDLAKAYDAMWAELKEPAPAHPKVPAEPGSDPGAKRPKPAKAEPGEKLRKRQCWIAKVAGRPAFRIYAHTQELAEAQLAPSINADVWVIASLTLEFTNRSQDFNGVPMLSDLAPEQVRSRIRQLLAEAEHASGSGFVASTPEEPKPEFRTVLGIHKATSAPLFWLKALDLAQAEDIVAMGLTRSDFDAIALAELPEGESAGSLPDFETFDPEDMPSAVLPLFVGYYRDIPVFGIRRESRDAAVQEITKRFEWTGLSHSIRLGEAEDKPPRENLPDFADITNDQIKEDIRDIDREVWDFDASGHAPEGAVSGAAPDTTPQAPVTAAPEVPSYPTESPRDPLATLPVEDLGIRKPLCGQIIAKGVRFAAHLEEELGGDLLGDVIASQEQEEYVRRQIRKWETDRAARIAADGSWLDEELTHAAFRLGDAPNFWAKLRAQGASDRELRDAINSMFPHRINHGWGVHYRVGSHFIRGTAPAFFRGGSVPSRDAEPALEGKPLIDRVRQLLAIPTREEPPAKGDGKGAKQRKAVKA